MLRAFVFPGQGSQSVGMGKELAEAFAAAKEVFQEVDDALEQNLSSIMFDGPIEDLTLTENAQPALMAVSMAVLRTLEAEGGFDLTKSVNLVAGHSLGEYSALAAAGTFSLADTARLLKIRGQAMQKAVPVGEGAMAAVLGLELDDAQSVADEAAQGEVCDFANDNAPGQIVLSGSTAAIERAVDIAKERGAKRAMLLPVSAPFHCAMMAPAADAMAKALAKVDMKDPLLPLVANVTAEKVHSAEICMDLLVKQVTGRVRWRESVDYLGSQGIETLVEIGSGKVLTGLTRRINRELTGISVGTPADVETFLASL